LFIVHISPPENIMLAQKALAGITHWRLRAIFRIIKNGTHFNDWGEEETI
jgi:hypothetical protein